MQYIYPNNKTFTGEYPSKIYQISTVQHKGMKKKKEKKEKKKKGTNKQKTTKKREGGEKGKKKKEKKKRKLLIQFIHNYIANRSGLWL